MDHRASPELLKRFRSFSLRNATTVFRGSCSDPVPASEVPEDSEGPNTIFHGMIPSSEYLMSFLVPAVVITCMLLLAIVLACVLHRKRKAGKLSLFYTETLPPRTPVILQDELYEESAPFQARCVVPNQHFQNPEEDQLIQGTRIVVQQDGSSHMVPRPTPTYKRV